MDTVHFDSSNYGTTQTVTVAGVDNDVDVGDSYEDYISFAVTADDTCDNSATGTACNQKVAYNGYDGLLIVAVTVVDDDVAGVTYSEDSLATAINNYGDEYATDSYSVYLDSEHGHRARVLGGAALL